MPYAVRSVPAPLPADEKKPPFGARAARVAAIAAQHADTVDADARFPAEALAGLRAEKLLGMMVPRKFGGEGATTSDVVDVCYQLGRACASTGMIFAMHQVKVACVVRHGIGETWHEEFLGRLADQQWLIASSTTEGKGGGNVRASEAPIERDGARIFLMRDASVISYGAEADAIVTTARRDADAGASDQVLAVFEKKNYTLTPTASWNTLGMRGTCSGGFTLKAVGEAGQVLSEPYESIHTKSMVPAAHLMWSGVWAGIAAGAVERARKYMRKAMRGSDGQLPPGAPHFTTAAANLRALRAIIAASLARYETIENDSSALGGIDFSTAINLLKVDASELAVSTVLASLRATGLSGYRNDSDVSVGRALRDVLSAPLMINNDRILSSLAKSALLSDVPDSVRD